ncbi:MAG TPA: hypothetical protein PLL78_09340 [Fimbriimonadaceae bacterium]|nr:hypothetical protein [Fimbriimonadaceae bacterium]
MKKGKWEASALQGIEATRSVVIHGIEFVQQRTSACHMHELILRSDNRVRSELQRYEYQTIDWGLLYVEGLARGQR